MEPTAPGFALCLITRGSPSELAAVQRALEGAAPGDLGVLLRSPGSTADALRSPARQLAQLVRPHGASLRVHTHAQLASEVGAAGVHLASHPAPGFRAAVPSHLRVGVSCHDRAQLEAAAREGADYAFLSPFADTPGKGAPLGPGGFAALARTAPLPVVALGGMGPHNAAAAIAAGACAVACIRHVLDAGDPAQAVRALLNAMRGQPAPDQ